MTEDPRCCGTGTCLIDAQGRCWCGQQWDGAQMCHPAATTVPVAPATTRQPDLAASASDSAHTRYPTNTID